MKTSQIPVFILAGGLGTRISEETSIRPKPMIELGGKPILLHIIQYYSKFGFKEFILCTGFKGWQINDYFAEYFKRNVDITVDLKSGNVVSHSQENNLLDCKVTCCFTGANTQTGARVKQACDKYLNDRPLFAVTYGDGLTDADLHSELNNHIESRKIATVLAVNPPSRFGEFRKDVKSDKLLFIEKPHTLESFINGGFFFFNREILEHLNDDPQLILEQDPLVNLAKQDQLNIFPHTGFWQCMDTLRDKIKLEDLIANGSAPWISK